MKRRGRPVFAFIDPDISDQPFLVERVPYTGFHEWFSLLGGLLSLVLADSAGTGTPATVVYVTDPVGKCYEVASFETERPERDWVARARAAVVERGAAGIADMSNNARFRKRYGNPFTPDSLLSPPIARARLPRAEESKRA